MIRTIVLLAGGLLGLIVFALVVSAAYSNWEANRGNRKW